MRILQEGTKWELKKPTGRPKNSLHKVKNKTTIHSLVKKPQSSWGKTNEKQYITNISQNKIPDSR